MCEKVASEKKPSKHKKEAYQRWQLGQVTWGNIETLSDHAGTGLGKPKPTWDGCERQQKRLPQVYLQQKKD